MRCYGLTTIPPIDNRFCVPTTATPIFLRPIGPTKYPTRISLRSPKPRATLNDAATASSEVLLSFYDLLGISESGSVAEIKRAYKQLARKYHPDVSPPGRVEEYTKRFIRVQEAYETLSDPSRRAMYDSDMARGVNFAFNARRSYHRDDQVIEHKYEWKPRWQSQLSELKKRSNTKDAAASGGNMSWAARMRQQKNNESSSNDL